MKIMKRVFYLIIPVFGIVVASIYSCDSQKAPGDENEAVAFNNNLVRRGEYLVTITGCNDCHSPKKMGPGGPEIDSAYMLSGYPSARPVPEFPAELVKKGFVVVNGDLTAAMGPWGTSFAGNITSDATGIGNWSEEQFSNAIIHGKYKGLEGARPLMPPMPWQNLQHMSKADIRAIFAYLKSTKPVNNVVPNFRPAE